MRTDLGLRMAVRPAFCQKFAKAVHVDPHPLPVQFDALPADLQPALRAGPGQRREGPAQGGAGPPLVVLRPEQTRERVAGVAPPGDGQVSEESDRLTRIDLDRLAVV